MNRTLLEQNHPEFIEKLVIEDASSTIRYSKVKAENVQGRNIIQIKSQEYIGQQYKYKLEPLVDHLAGLQVQANQYMDLISQIIIAYYQYWSQAIPHNNICLEYIYLTQQGQFKLLQNLENYQRSSRSFIKQDPEKQVIQTLRDIYDLGNVFYFTIYKSYRDDEFKLKTFDHPMQDLIKYFLKQLLINNQFSTVYDLFYEVDKKIYEGVIFNIIQLLDSVEKVIDFISSQSQIDKRFINNMNNCLSLFLCGFYQFLSKKIQRQDSEENTQEQLKQSQVSDIFNWIYPQNDHDQLTITVLAIHLNYNILKYRISPKFDLEEKEKKILNLNIENFFAYFQWFLYFFHTSKLKFQELEHKHRYTIMKITQIMMFRNFLPLKEQVNDQFETINFQC